MSLSRTHTPTTRAKTKVAILAAAALLAATSAGCAEVSQTLRGIDNAIAVALGAQPKSAGSGQPLTQADAGASSAQKRTAKKPESAAEKKKSDALGKAIIKGNAKTVKKLLTEGADANMSVPYEFEVDDEDGGEPFVSMIPALSAAVMAGKQEIVKILLENGADVNVQRDDDLYGRGETPLMLAAAQGKTAIAKLLLDRGADVNMRDDYGDTALINAISGYGVSDAVANGKREIAKLLLEKGANPNIAGMNGMTALLWEVEGLFGDEVGLVNLLIAKGANVNAADKDGMTPLMRAARHCSAKAAQILLDNGADKAATNFLGNTAWIYAAEQASYDKKCKINPEKLNPTPGRIPHRANPNLHKSR